MQRYLASVECLASRDDLVSDAKSKYAPQDFVEQLEGLAEQGSPYKTQARS